MCTVTFIPANKKAFLTHSRDEKKQRPKAAAPAIVHLNGTTILFPRDGAAGGSWVGLNEFGHSAVLLNGAFKNHHPQPPYRKSRGLIFLDLLSSIDMLQAYEETSLENIEPFTIIFWNGSELFECRWDATSKFIKELDGNVAHIWSSSTLYEDAIMDKRLSWFKEWHKKNPVPDADDVIGFHLEGGDGDERNDLKMRRDNELLTLSITSIEISVDAGKMKYLDLADNMRTSYRLMFKKAVVESR